MFENKYPYTDFHELNLDWFLAEFKKVHNHVDNLDATVHEFTEFVTNYFNNLDVQEEINNKLNAMAADGTLSALIQPLFDEYKEQIDSVVENQFDIIGNQNTTISALSARMDTFSHLTDGSTTGDAELADIRVGYDGKTYATAGDAVRGQIGDLTDQIIWNNSFDIFKTDAYNTESGSAASITYTYDATTNTWDFSGTATGNSRYYIFGDLTTTNNYIIPGKKYYIRMNQTLHDCSIQICFRISPDGVGDIITNITESSVYEVPSQAYTGFSVRFEVRTGKTVDFQDFKISMITAESNEELTDDVTQIRNLLDIEDITEITVKQDGTGDFTSIRTAVESIVDASVTHKYQISVYPGTYDIMSYYTPEEISDAVENNLHGIMLTDGISIRGIGDKNNIILTAELDPDIYSTQIRNMISTLNITGNSSIENMTILSNNIRYCIHDSFSSLNTFYEHKFKDLVLRCFNSTASREGRSYGCGIARPGCNIYLENIDFGSDFVIHSNANVQDTCRIYIKSCRGNTAILESHQNSVTNHIVKIDDSLFQGIQMHGTSGNLIIESQSSPNSYLNNLGGAVYTTEDIIKVYNIGIPKGYAVSKDRYTFSVASGIGNMYGIVINEDANYTYIQRTGHINLTDLGMTGLAVGNLIGINASGQPVKVTNYESAFGRIDFKDSNLYYAKIR